MLKQGGHTSLEINGVKHQVKVQQKDIESFLKTGSDGKPPIAPVKKDLESPSPSHTKLLKHNTEVARPDSNANQPSSNLDKGILVAESLL